MEKSKEATARIVGYKELGIERCYTLESTYCGMDQGEFAVRLFLFLVQVLSISTDFRLPKIS